MSRHNLLRNEASPYLRQHADNPVDWRPWNEAAFAEAKRRDVPIFLSIGYSSCHWCHVMERESYEDKEVAALLNQSFVCVKVDREERPDIDEIYMRAAMAMTGSGGWPLNMVLTPDAHPIFASTYLPPHSRNGMAGLDEVVRRISAAWKQNRAEAEALGMEVMKVLKSAPDTKADADRAMIQKCLEELREEYEGRYGGFGGPPKFPTPHKVMFLLRRWHLTGDEEALLMAEKTLYKMARGGIFDHLGGGFHRYSTDIKWLVPHYEKMLYDQALLAMAYTEMYQARKQKWARQAALDTFSYVLGRMLSPEGLFYSAEDADSSGREGAYYTWTYDEVASLIESEDLDLFCRAYDVQRGGNFRDPVSNVRDGVNILHLEKDAAELAEAKGMKVEDVEESLSRSRARLLLARMARDRPFRDEKCLLDWNGLMIAAMAKAAVAFKDERLLSASISAANAVEVNLRAPSGLMHSFFEGKASVPGFLNDHAFYAWGLLELYQATLYDKCFELCKAVLAQIEEGFGAPDGGLFTIREGEVRTRDVYDGAIPSGSAVTAYVAAMTAALDEKQRVQGRPIVEASWKQIKASPAAHAFMLIAAEAILDPPALLQAGKLSGEFLEVVRMNFHPYLVVKFTPSLDGVVLCGRSSCHPTPRNTQELTLQLVEERI